MKPLVLPLIALMVFACAVRAAEAQRHPWTHLKFNDDPGEFHFAIVGDRTGRHRAGIFERGIEKLNLLRPNFVMSVGDLIEGYTRDEAEIDQQWDEIEKFTAKLQAPFFYVAGNHDLSNPVQADKWRERFGQTYYHFVYRDVLFLCLNTYDPEQRISPEQIAFVEKVLKENPRVRWTCVFMHEPLWDYKKPTGWDDVEKLLLDRPYTVFAGHYHTYTKYVRHDRRYIVLATTGGGFKDGMTSPELGSFDHITWVTMLPDGPRIANIALDGIHDEDVRTEATAKLIDAVMRGEVLQISPVLAESEQFERSPVTLKFTNDSDAAMTVKGTIPPVGALRAKPEQFEVNVSAKSSATTAIELCAQPPTAIPSLKPITVKWSAIYQPPGRNAVSVPHEDIIAVEKISACPRSSKSIEVDGDLQDWTSLPFSANAASGAADCSYQFGVEHDDKFLYIAIKTRDDHAILNANKEPWSQDGVEVRLDARPEPLRSQGRGHGEFKDILVVSMSPPEHEKDMVLYSRELLPAGVRAVCVKTPTGHNAEIAIPASYLDEKQGGPWKGFRLNIAVDDFDQVAGPLKALWWRPDWRTPLTYAGSGTFQRK